jgi:ankyrin repeat protein
VPTSKPVLPSRPHLEHLKKQAKDLLERAHNGNDEALRAFGEAVRRFDPTATDPKTLTLVEAQHTLARGYGFASWPLLKKHVLDLRASHLRDEGLPEDREERMSLLYEAIEHNDETAARTLLDMDMSLADGWGDRRPLQHAAECDRPGMVDLLVDAGASFEPEQSWAHSPLSWSITTQALSAARRLAERGAYVDLWCAAGLGDVGRLETFFEEGGRLKANASRHGATRRAPDGTRLPLPTEPIEVLNDALYIACRTGQLETARALLDHGADPSSYDGYVHAPALHWAGFAGNHALVELLLARGANPRQVDGQYKCEYREFAVRNPIEWSFLRALKNAIGGDPSLVNERGDSWGPPLHAAAAKGLVDHVAFLLDAGADANALDYAGRTALECAALGEDRDAVEKLTHLLRDT